MCQVYIKWVENAIATHIKQPQAAGYEIRSKKKQNVDISHVEIRWQNEVQSRQPEKNTTKMR